MSAGRSSWWLLSLCLVGMLCSAGCSTFHREWKQAAAQPVPGDSLAGRWEGRWLSEVNGHNGRLRGILAPASATNCVAHFHATYWKVFRASYAVTLDVQAIGDTWRFSGEEDLGFFAGGVYRYKGHATATNFFATYESKHDRGTFELRRPE